jgi:ubiquinone/menaquinone biosynthesis C-methylase UbiE
MPAMDFLPGIALTQNDKGTLDFIKSLKSTEVRKRGPLVRQEYAELAQKQGVQPKSREEIGQVMTGSTAWRMDRAMARFSQELMYERVHKRASEQRPELSGFLNSADPQAKGSLRLNPSLEIPEWYKADYHVQPGGMYREELIGFITRVTQNVYFGGNNDNYEQQLSSARACPKGPWRRVLDLGCGSKSVFALKQEFPDAEVHGIDLSAPLLKYSHKAAESMGLEVHLSQQNSERTDFPDGAFDLISNCIIFHEMPDSAAVNTIREAYRLLRPGGWFVINDAMPYSAMEPFGQFFSDWQTGNNIEPYWREAGLRDLKAIMREAGFQNVTDNADRGPVNGRMFPWTTMGQK